VLTLGNSISGVEIPCDIARNLSASVTASARKPRYIIQKMKDGIPADWRFFNKMAFLIGHSLPPEQAGQGLRDQILALHGNPADYGALPPSDNILEAGVGQAQDFLEMCRAGLLAVKPAPLKVEGSTVLFSDGSEADFDVILFCTGYGLEIPFLDDELQKKLRVGRDDLDLYDLTFSPYVEGLYFVGQLKPGGPYLPVLELQGRYVAEVHAGKHRLPAVAEMAEQAGHSRALRGSGVPVMHHEVAIHLARALGVEPRVEDFPDLAAALTFGSLVPARYRLAGPGKRANGFTLFHEALAEVGLSADWPVGPEEMGLLKMLSEQSTADVEVLPILRELTQGQLDCTSIPVPPSPSKN